MIPIVLAMFNLLLVNPAAPAASQPAIIDTWPDTWAATDALGRSLIDAEQAGPPRPGKFVGIFYFLWMGQHGTDGPYDITKILAQDPAAMQKPDSPLWGPMHKMHHWGEALFGYYFSDDAWVLARHAQMLSDAGVDAIIFDVTNQVTYAKVYLRLCEVYTELRRLGRKTPQIVFLTPFWDPPRVAAELYQNLYKPGKYSDLWFHWKGKPLLLADPDKVSAEVREFFTLRKPQPDYFQGPTGPNQWGWLEIHPQHAFYNSEGKPEEVTVGVGQNGTGRRLCAFSEKNTYGRSWHNGKKDERPDAVLHGLNLAEQWEHALKIDPEFVFITGWNEWVAGRFAEFAGVREPVMFVDEYTQEYSRDIEPMKGGHGDNYYYQMINYIRRFKGVRKAAAAGGPSTIRIDGDFSDWAGVQPEFRDDRGDTAHRDHPGFEKAGRYVNRTGRNDFTLLKVAYDDSVISFYARTAEPVTASSDPHWMLLFINADADAKTGWEGYDFIVNRKLQDGQTTQLESLSRGESGSGWQCQPKAELQYRVSGRELELSIPRAALGLKAGRPHLHFKWADNIQKDGDVMEFTVNGDAAPNCRFTYVYR